MVWALRESFKNGHCRVAKDVGSGGGTSGRAKAFCPGRLGSNPRSDFGFF